MICRPIRLLITVMLWGAVLPLQAQNTSAIHGKVIGRSGMGLSNTLLRLSSSGDSARTDAEGLFAIKAAAGDSLQLYNVLFPQSYTIVLPGFDSLLIRFEGNQVQAGRWSSKAGALKDTITERSTAPADTLPNAVAGAGDALFIKGRITGSAGQPLPNASITYPDGKLYTAGEDGVFSIPFRQGIKVVFSNVGNPDLEVTLTNPNKPLSIRLEGKKSSEELERVTVTAMGISKKSRSVGYAISEVKGSEIQTAKEVNFVNNLAGRVPGVSITTNSGSMGGSSKVTIRGPKSILGDNNALFVVDGIPFSNLNTNSYGQQIGGGGFDYGSPVQDINPDDIDQVSVLKGAAATALYGSRGQNGVVLVTTKKTNGGGKKIGINYSLNVQTDRVYVLPDYQNKYGGGSNGTFDTLIRYYQGKWFNGRDTLIDNRTYFKNTPTYNDPLLGGYDLLPEFAVDESWGPALDGRLVRHYWSFDQNKNNPYFGQTAPWSPQPDNIKDFFQTGVTVTNSVSAGGSSDKGSIRIGLADTRQRFVLPNSRLSRTNVGINGSYKITGQLTASAGARYSYTKAKGRPGTGFTGQNVMNLFSEYGQRQWDMSRMQEYRYADGTQISWNRKTFDDPTPNFANNPYWTRYMEYQNDDRSRLFGSVGLEYKPLDWLSFNAQAFMDSYHTLQEERTAKDYFLGSYARNTIDFREMNYMLTANIKKDIGRLFNIGATIGGNMMKQNVSLFTGTTPAGAGLITPGVYTLPNISAPPTITEARPRKQINSLFGTATIGYNNNIFLELSGRNDWSSTLPAANRSYFYPSASTSVVFSDWLQHAKWLSFGKVRAGIAQVGSDTDPYNIYLTYLLPQLFNGVPYVSVDDLKRNPLLLPEKTTEKEAGIELKLFGNRVGIDFTYYDRVTKNQIIPVNVSPTNGYTQYLLNAGSVRNRGIELRLDGTPVQSENFKWNIGFNFSKNKNKVLDLAQNGNEVIDRINIGTERRLNQVSVVAVKGQPLGTLYGFDYTYLNGQKLIDESGHYIKTATVVPLGSVYPDYVGGITNNLTYKNITLGALIDYSKGGKFFSYTNMYGLASGLLAETAEGDIRENGVEVSGVLPDGTSFSKTLTAMDHFKNNFGKNINAANVYDASYVYLREVTLGYQLPHTWAQKISADNITFSLYGRNLWLIRSNAPNVDPSNIANGTGNIQGLEGGALPSVRSFGLNLNIGF
ncbi:SusC/RagA family TonB-linked outer membrane protein [Niabella drilacis]|uniref:TonB-linked outer membrane protein, SusC/RagA family n=1 Tax=Niabella drilacis (strain DSM 25811 / CCM 8410 / CCUG 62505 / LMG 26954 / E90) TaxID=1285928 RepID=A0A1G6L788_NIADE|nr:SusC/RagA family TonB-linked outer membrane protein [Niabella drilacis]SDC38615.1 TonB-linked outer membrane protein, SusC/RagA family [Niabella drilacis]